MNLEQNTELNKTKEIKLYSSKSISGATFLGGPLAAGYLISENFKALNKPEEGRTSLITGIIATIVLFGILLMLSERVSAKIPSQLIPLIYTGIIWGIVEWTQGDILKSHKENENSFFSGWKAAGVGFISLIIVLIGLFGFIFLSPDDMDYEKYDTDLDEFFKNETESLTFYDHINTDNNQALINDLENRVIPLWNKNIDIINGMNNIDNLSPELLNQNSILLDYSNTRIELFNLMKKVLVEETNEYDTQLSLLNIKLETIISKLK